MTRAAAAGLLLALGLLSASLVALRRPFGTGDFVAIWGLKARAIHASGSLASVVRVDPAGEFSHPEYPPLWPCVLAGAAVAIGRFDELLLTPLWPALALLASLAAARATRGGPGAKLLAGAIVALLPYYRAYPGYAEALLVLFLLLAVGELDRLQTERLAPARLAAFLVLAAWTKPEGALAGLVVAALLLSARRLRPGALAGLCVVLVGVLPWRLYVRSLTGGPLPSAFDAGAFTPARLGAALVAVAAETGWAWAGIAAFALLLALAPGTRRLRSALILGVALFLAALAAAYGFSRFDVGWHVRWSWDRVLFLAAACLAPAAAEAAEEALGPAAEEAPS